MGNKLQLIKHIKEKGKDRTWKELAKLYGYHSEDTVRKIVSKKLTHYTTTEKLNEGEGETLEYNLDKGEMKVSHIWDHAPTPEEVIKHHRIDERKWKLSNVWMKMVPTGYLTSALFSQKKSVDISPDDVLSVLNNYKSNYKPLTKEDLLINDNYTSNCCVLISLTDFHLAKLQVDGETIYTKIETYKDVLNQLISKAYRAHKIDEVIYIIGSDFLHSDNYQNSTTNLTQQYPIVQWYDEYEIAFDLQVYAINHLRQFCNKLHVVHVPGNHDRTKSYYLAHALSQYFKPDQNIIFDRSPENTKVYTYHQNFIGFHHGDTNVTKLPLYFASKYPEQWGSTKFRTIALGDKHHRKDWKFSLSGTEEDGTRMFIAPALTGTDQWHKDKGYDLAIRAGIAKVFNESKGYCAEYEQRI